MYILCQRNKSLNFKSYWYLKCINGYENEQKFTVCRQKKHPQTFFLDYKSAVKIFHLHLFYLQHSKVGVTSICIHLKYL